MTKVLGIQGKPKNITGYKILGRELSHCCHLYNKRCVDTTRSGF
jgi:hypothetical protein